MADLLQRDKAEMARMESLDTGKRLVESEIDIDDVTSVFRHFGRVADAEAGRVVDTGTPGVVSRVVREPVGVCGLITPWNYPLLQVSWKVAPALAAGCTFVLKPSELSPHTAIHLMRLLDEAGLPAGVGNLVLGDGPDAGAPLSEDPRVDLVSFTGGLGTGKRIMAAASGTVKKVALELGGKNPNIVFADADRETALDMALTAVFLHSGQVCSAGARLIVEESIAEEFVAELVERAREIRLGGPFDEEAETGALISQGHLDKVTAYVEAGVAEGAERARRRQAGHRRRPGRGLLLRADRPRRRRLSGMSVAQDESFGPVLTVETFTRRGRGGPDRQRLDLRPGRRRLDPGRRQGPAGRGAAAHGHGVDQRLPPLRRPGGVGRLQAVRHRPRARRSTASRSTRRPSTCGTTSRRGVRLVRDRFDEAHRPRASTGRRGCAVSRRER